MSLYLLPAAARYFRAIAHPCRVRLVLELVEQERTVLGLADAVGLPAPNAARHLALLLRAGVVRRRRVGGTVRYQLADDTPRRMCDLARATLFPGTIGSYWSPR
jgi:DNA-binding transcriptional ArsR family regulator